MGAICHLHRSRFGFGFHISAVLPLAFYLSKSNILSWPVAIVAIRQNGVYGQRVIARQSIIVLTMDSPSLILFLCPLTILSVRKSHDSRF